MLTTSSSHQTCNRQSLSKGSESKVAQGLTSRNMIQMAWLQRKRKENKWPKRNTNIIYSFWRSRILSLISQELTISLTSLKMIHKSIINKTKTVQLRWCSQIQAKTARRRLIRSHQEMIKMRSFASQSRITSSRWLRCRKSTKSIINRRELGNMATISWFLRRLRRTSRRVSLTLVS